MSMSDKEIRQTMMRVILRASLAYQIRELRLVRNMTQAQVARGIGTKQSVIARMEDPYGQMPNLTMLHKIAAFFDVGLQVNFASWPEFMRLHCAGRPPVVPLAYGAEVAG